MTDRDVARKTVAAIGGTLALTLATAGSVTADRIMDQCDPDWWLREGRNLIRGTAGADTLVGTDGGDVICGFGGNDTIRAGDGNDMVLGGPGRDRLFGGPGEDELVGGPGKDLLVGGKGADKLRGDKGADIYRMAVKAVSTLPVKVLLSTGGASLEPECLGSIPDNLTVETWVDPSDIYPRAAALLCHGGSGTILEGLAAGLPMVLTPLHADQPDNAALVEKSGAGVALSHPTSSEIADALSHVLDDQGVRARAVAISNEISDLPGLEEAVDEMLTAI